MSYRAALWRDTQDRWLVSVRGEEPPELWTPAGGPVLAPPWLQTLGAPQLVGLRYWGDERLRLVQVSWGIFVGEPPAPASCE